MGGATFCPELSHRKTWTVSILDVEVEGFDFHERLVPEMTALQVRGRDQEEPSIAWRGHVEFRVAAAEGWVNELNQENVELQWADAEDFGEDGDVGHNEGLRLAEDLASRFAP